MKTITSPVPSPATALLLASVALVLSSGLSCVIHSDVGGGAGGSGNWDLTLDSFTVDATTVSAGAPTATPFKFNWAVHYTRGLPSYIFSVHFLPADSVDPARTASTKVFGRNCGSPASIFECNTTGEQSCTYAPSGSSGQDRVTCTVGTVPTNLELPPGDYQARGGACFFDTSLDEICRELGVRVTLAP